MVTQPQARELIARAVLQDTRITDDLDVILQEPDGEGSDSQKTVPLLYVSFTETTEPDVYNSDLVDYKTNDDGERVARIFGAEWEAVAQIEIWTADRSRHDIDELGEQLHSILYAYDSSSLDRSFQNADGMAVPGLWNFSLQDGGREDDLTQTPTVRRYRQLADVYGTRYYVETPSEPIREVDPEFDQGTAGTDDSAVITDE